MSNLLQTGVFNANNIIEFACINSNLMPNSYTMPLGTANPSTGTWRLAGSNNMTRSRVLIESGMYGLQNSGIQTTPSGGYVDASCYGIDSFPFEADTEYVLSFDARLTAGIEGYAGFLVQQANILNGSHIKIDRSYYVTPLTTNWTRCWIHFKTNSATTRNIYIGITTGETSVTTQMCKVKLERGQFLTTWIPNTSDPEYVNYPPLRMTADIFTDNFIEW